MDDLCDLKTKISEDGLSATLIVPAGFDRAKLDLPLCDSVLVRDGIEINPETKQRLQDFLNKIMDAPEGVFEDVIAKGSPPRHGVDGHVEWMLEQLKGDTPASPDPAGDDQQQDQPNSSGSEKDPVSFYDQSVYILVKVGDELGRIHQATAGFDGRDVAGKTIAAREGRPLDFKYDETISLGKGDVLIAQAEGVLNVSNKTAQISNTIEVKEYVDFNTGNIDFTGNIVVHKGVRDCFKVQASGNIEVKGLIEAATIIAGEDLHSTGGFAGREQGVAKVSRDLYAKYLDSVDVHVRGRLCVDREMINCKARILGSIDSPRGAIIGGETSCAGEIVIGELGAEGLPHTVICIGSAPHLTRLMKKLSEVNDVMVKQRQRLLNEEKKLKFEPDPYLAQQNLPRLEELTHEIAEIQLQIERAEPALEKLKAKTKPTGEINISVNRMIYPNTIIVYEGLSYRIKSEIKGPVKIGMSPKGQLNFRQGDSAPVMLARQADLSDAA